MNDYAKDYVERAIRHATWAAEDGYEIAMDSAIGFDEWEKVKARRKLEGWELRLYTEECLNFQFFSAMFQRRSYSETISTPSSG